MASLSSTYVSTSLVLRPPRPAFVACSTEARVSNKRDKLCVETGERGCVSVHVEGWWLQATLQKEGSWWHQVCTSSNAPCACTMQCTPHSILILEHSVEMSASYFPS